MLLHISQGMWLFVHAEKLIHVGKCPLSVIMVYVMAWMISIKSYSLSQ